MRFNRSATKQAWWHEYAAGIHHSLVEHGGFLKNGLGLSHQQMVHLATLETANLVAARVMGSVEYMRNLRQRYIPQGHADETDTIPMETSGDEGENEMPFNAGGHNNTFEPRSQFLEWSISSKQSI